MAVVTSGQSTLATQIAVVTPAAQPHSTDISADAGKTRTDASTIGIDVVTGIDVSTAGSVDSTKNVNLCETVENTCEDTAQLQISKMGQFFEDDDDLPDLLIESTKRSLEALQTNYVDDFEVGRISCDKEQTETQNSIHNPSVDVVHFTRKLVLLPSSTGDHNNTGLMTVSASDLLNNDSAIVSPTKVTVCGEVVVAHENVSMTNISKESTGFVDISEEVATKVCPRAFADLVASSVAAPRLSGDPDSFVDLDVEEDEADSRATPKLSIGVELMMERLIRHSRSARPCKSRNVEIRLASNELFALFFNYFNTFLFKYYLIKNICKIFSSNSELSFVAPYQK